MHSDFTQASDGKTSKVVIQADIQTYAELHKRYLDEIYRYLDSRSKCNSVVPKEYLKGSIEIKAFPWT